MSNVASLYILKQHQGRGFGGQAMDLLERVAVEQYNAAWITLDTAAYWTVMDPDGFAIEDKTREGRTVAWYRARGYEQFKVRRAQSR